MSDHPASSDIVQLSGRKFLAGCAAAAALIWLVGRVHPFPSWVVAVEVVLTVLSLFVFGSVRYRLDKNALTYGAGLVILATFWQSWWTGSALRAAAESGVAAAWGPFLHRHLLTLHGLDGLVHADTMLFILGLTFFVAVIAQTRLLESLSFAVLQRNRGFVVPTVAILTGVVSAASGILDGVSMIGLMIRTLIIILFLARIPASEAVYTVMISTVVTTVCGMWLAYGEPPNLIMKANLHPLLDDAFFLRYCLPAAIGSYLIVAWNLSRRFRGRRVALDRLDVLDRHTADVRFLQASRHGEVLTAVEFLEEHRAEVGERFEAVLARLQKGEPLGESLVNEHIPREKRLSLMGRFVSEDLAGSLDDYYVHVYGKNDHKADESAVTVGRALDEVRRRRLMAQRVGALAFLPFVGLLIAHAVDHAVPLFLSSFAGFAAALTGIAGVKAMRRLALREAWHEYKEYFFLLPLFFSITLLQKTGFFSVIADLLRTGIDRLGAAHVAYGQFWFATLLSALLDNNVVADFAGRALQGLDVQLVHLFAMAQIAGYALGGCWTHIGSAQSVVAYAFIRREIDERYTPFQWIKAMTPIILEIAVLMSVVVYAESWLQARQLLH
jgi:hypothetical protein